MSKATTKGRRASAAHTYPDRTLEKHWQEKGYRYTVCWEQPGPKDTGIAWHVAYALNGCIVIVQTFEGGGWDAYTADRTNNVQATFGDVSQRCGMEA